MIFKIVAVLGIFYSAVHCGPARKRDAFDPEQLMTHYMDMRTNQGLFGSYHPNDLVKSIVEYFESGGPQSMNSNQWGLSVYNPNDKMGQYMGNMNSAGNLGPEPKGSTNANKNTKLPDGAAFNPDTLNQRLMHDAFKKGNQYSDFVPHAQQTASQGKGNLGFNADILNRQMMESAMKKLDTHSEGSKGTSGHSTGTTSNDKTEQGTTQAPASQMGVFNPDTLNAGLLQSISSPGATGEKKTTPGMAGQSSNSRAMMLGFNPDTLNAGLLGSIGYNPNTAMGNMPTYDGNGSMMQETMGKPDSKDSNASGGLSSQGKGPSSATSTTGVNKEMGLNQNGGKPNNPIGDATGPGIGAQTGQGTMAGMYTGTQSQALTASGTGSNFSAGGIGPQGYGNQKSDVPPGIPSGAALHQTDPATAKVHGIGGMG